jgi:hypothetical protein
MRHILVWSLVVACAWASPTGQGTPGGDANALGFRSRIAAAEIQPLLEVLRDDLVPGELRTKTGSELARAWDDWASGRDAVIRARVAQGDEDSVTYFLLFGTSFTPERRANERELAALAVQPGESLAPLQRRIADFIAATASPGANDRLQFVRDLFARKGIDPSTDEGKVRARRWLEEQAPRVAGAGLARSSTLLDASAAAIERQTLFRDRGLSSDTSIFIDYALDEALHRLASAGVLTPGVVRRVAVVGPGLDFTDKLEGYDFYPQQTIQPFATIDSLRRHRLAAAELQMTAIDLSPRVVRHLESARERAAAGQPYPLVLARGLTRSWSPPLVEYWRRAGDQIGEPAAAVPPPANAGPVEVRRLLVRPSVTRSIVPRDLNVVLERLDPAGEPFDLVLATNVLLYYDVFEQALAAANIARMLRSGGMLLTNNRLFELPPVPLREVGFTDVTYMTLPGIGETGDRIVWYRRD